MSWPTTSRQSRGYGAAWDRLRLRILRRDNYVCQCQRCAKDGVIRTADQVDHRVPKAHGGTDDPSNLQAINRFCHQLKTDADSGRRTRRRFDVHGNPVE